jgi:hypothetical protein
MNLTALETDFLSDMAQDDHGVWEVFEFVRLHNPDADDADVLRVGRALLQSWVERGWLRLAGDGPKWGTATSIGDVLRIVDRHGLAATRYFDSAPWLDLTPKAYVDVDWLPRAV